MIPLLADAGYRVIAMDQLGMGRSDKPIDLEYHSYINHVKRIENFIYKLELDGITAFVQDWGSLTGLNVIGNNTELFDRVVLGNGTLPELVDYVPYKVSKKLNPIISNMIVKHLHDTPAQQEIMRDDNGKLLIDDDVNKGFGYWIRYALDDERLRASHSAEAKPILH